jgi:hypothetical protein
LSEALFEALLEALPDGAATALRVLVAAALAGTLADAVRPAGTALAAAATLEDFLRVFLDIRLPFVAFRGSTIAVLRVTRGMIGFAADRWASLIGPDYGYKDFEASPVRSLTGRWPP